MKDHCALDLQKLDELAKTNNEQNITLAELKLITRQNSEILSEQKDLLSKIEKILASNTKDLAYHIKRTDILQSRQTKIIWLVVLFGGFLVGKFGPEALKFILPLL